METHKLTSYSNYIVKLLVVTFGIVLALFVSNTINFDYTLGIFMNGDKLLAYLSDSGPQGWDVNYRGLFHIGFRSGHVGYGTEGVFNPTAQKIVLFLIAVSGVVCFHFFGPTKGASQKAYTRFWFDAFIKAALLLGSILVLDWVAFAFEATYPIIVIASWLFIATVGSYCFFKINKGNIYKTVFEFAFLFTLLINITTMNHKTYCAQIDYERPLLSAFTNKCKRNYQ